MKRLLFNLLRIPFSVSTRWACGVLLLVAVAAPTSAGTGLDSLPPSDCVVPTRPATGGPIQVALEDAISSVGPSALLAIAPSPDEPTIRFAILRSGLVYRTSGCCSSTLALDISSRVFSINEGGLLGIALHPDFSSNGEIFLYYTAPNVATEIQTVVSRFRSFDNGLTFPPVTEEVILTLDQPTVIHNAGDIHFGPDGFLYIGLGDGGEYANAQDTSTLLGSFLRIDVDSATPYAIPSDNPFASGGGAPEIWAWGLRNPYRWGFDPVSGTIWAGDVGQSLSEEVDQIVAGANYGWPIREGDRCFLGDCSTPGLTDPVFTFSHFEGCAIVGGRVYRGSAVPALQGAYIYGDFCSRQIWAALPDGFGGREIVALATAPGFLGGFAQDSDGEVLVLVDSKAMRIVIDTTPPIPFPQKLSSTGCVDPTDPSKPGLGMVPYSVNSKLWSDEADKERWFSVPAGEPFSVSPVNGDLTLPIGSVTVKTFFLEDEPVETRLFVRHDDGGWAGYTYEWDADGLDATLLEDTKTKTIGGQEWTYPSRGQCMHCHGIGPGYTLGLELAQLNRTHFYAATGRSANQLETLDHLGLLQPPLAVAPGELPALRKDTLNEEARGYLHANCANCHIPFFAGTGVGIDLRHDATDMRLCDLIPLAGTLGVPTARILKPGNPPLSVLSRRMHLIGTDQMPPIAKTIVDLYGTQLIDNWITSWVSCEIGPDSDSDGVGDTTDNCRHVANPLQIDSLANGIGDACRTVCNDGIDNDADGLVDYPADAGCASLFATTEMPQCSDGIDNDGDGSIDSPMDLGCADASDSFEHSTCEDGIDNDGDGQIDWNGAATAPPDVDCGGRPYNQEIPEPGVTGALGAGILGLFILAETRRAATSSRAGPQNNGGSSATT